MFKTLLLTLVLAAVPLPAFAAISPFVSVTHVSAARISAYANPSPRPALRPSQIWESYRIGIKTVQCYSRTNNIGHWVKDHAGNDHCCSMDSIAAAIYPSHPSVSGFDAACCWRNEFWGPDGRCMEMVAPPVFKIDPIGPISR